MDFNIPEETKMLVSTIRRFVEEECLPVEREMMRTDPDWVVLPREYEMKLRNKLKQLGLLALGVPKEFGGGGLDAVSMVLVTIEQSKTVIGTAHRNPFRVDVNPLLYTASDYLKEKYLYPGIRGEKYSALAQTEPDAGSDAAAIKTRAVRDGDNWAINGVKMFSTLADTADFLYVTTVTDPTKGRAGHTMFIVDTDTPGVTITRVIPVLRPQYSTEILFDNCIIPDGQRLTEVGQGFGAAQKFLGRLRTGMAGECIGRAERSQKMTIDYIKQRSTFGQPLSTRQAIQWMLVDSHIEIASTRLMALETAWKDDQGMDVRQEASMLKLMATEMVYRVIDRCIQCHGGIGLTKELPLERWFREARVMRIVEGPSEIQKLIIARNLLR